MRTAAPDGAEEADDAAHGRAVVKTLPPIPGGLAGPPSACRSGADHLDAFAVGPDHRVWRWSWNGTVWTAPVPLPAFGAGVPGVGIAAVGSGPGRMEVFAAEASTRSPVWWRATNGQFLPSALLLPGGRANLPAIAVAAVCSSPDDIDVFAGGAGNTPWWWHWNGVAWTQPVSLPSTPNIGAERIAAVSPAPGRLDVFAAGAGNHLWHWGKAPGVPWGVEDLGGNIPAEGVSAVSWGPGRVDVFAASLSQGNALQYWWSDGNGFAGPAEFAGNLVAAGVSAVSHAPGHLDVFGVTGDQRIAHWEYSGHWEGPSYLGSAIPAGDVSAVANSSHRVDVFVAGAGRTLRQWPGGGLENATAQPWMNWPTNHEKNPVAGHLWPDSLEELVSIVREAEQRGRGVRAVGTSWSNSDVAVSPDYVVETDGLQRVITDVVDSCRNARGSALKLMHVEGGLKVETLNHLLDPRGLALTTMGGSSGQSIAGVVSTSAHGMDVDRAPIPDMVRAIHLVGPGGMQHWIEPSAGITDPQRLKAVLGLADENLHYDDDWFNSALVAMGSLGIIYSLVVEVVAQHDLVNTCVPVDWSAIRTTLKNGGAGLWANRGVQVVVNPYPDGNGLRTCYLTTRTDSTAPPTVPAPAGSLPGWFQSALSAVLLQNLRNARQDIDDDVTAITAQMQHLGTTTGIAHSVMGGADPPPVRGLTVEAMFDAQDSTRYVDFVDAVLEILRSAYYDDPARLGYLGWISLRFQGRSRAYLSPQSLSARTCSIEFAVSWRMPGVAFTEWQDTPILLARIEAAVRDFGGIQHWGLSNDLRREDVARAYPRLDTWRRVRWALSRGGTLQAFDSDFTRRCGLSDPPVLARAADFDDDGKADLTVWRPGSGDWHVVDSSDGSRRTRQWGQAGDVPVPGDYDGDGRTDFAVWRPSSGEWFVIDSSTGTARSQQWGEPDDLPVPADYDGDGRTDFAVWRPSTGMWWVIDSSTGNARSQQWGQFGDIPVPGRYDADAKADFAVWRPGTGEWFVIDSSTGAPRSRQWGRLGDLPVPGDYTGDGRTDFAFWRPADGGWWIDGQKLRPKQQRPRWGVPGDVPVPGDYDGDGRFDLAVWRPSDGTWWIVDSSTGAQHSAQWGQTGDVPV